MAYAVNGDPRYLHICVNAYDFLQRTQCYATGGYGPDERFMGPDGRLGRSLELYAGHAEIPCGTWAAFKLSRYLMGFTGEARFGDWIETLSTTRIGAALPTEPDGRTTTTATIGFPAGSSSTTGTNGRVVGHLLANDGRLPQRHLLPGPGALSVNLFVPSEVTW